MGLSEELDALREKIKKTDTFDADLAKAVEEIESDKELTEEHKKILIEAAKSRNMGDLRTLVVTTLIEATEAVIAASKKDPTGPLATTAGDRLCLMVNNFFVNGPSDFLAMEGVKAIASATMALESRNKGSSMELLMALWVSGVLNHPTSEGKSGR